MIKGTLNRKIPYIELVNYGLLEQLFKPDGEKLTRCIHRTDGLVQYGRKKHANDWNLSVLCPVQIPHIRYYRPYCVKD